MDYKISTCFKSASIITIPKYFVNKLRNYSVLMCMCQILYDILINFTIYDNGMVTNLLCFPNKENDKILILTIRLSIMQIKIFLTIL